MSNTGSVVAASIAVFMLITQIIVPSFRSPPNTDLYKLSEDVQNWLKLNNLDKYAKYFLTCDHAGLYSVAHCSIPTLADIKEDVYINHALTVLKQELAFKYYFTKAGIESQVVESVLNIGVKTLIEAASKSEEFFEPIEHDTKLRDVVLSLSSKSEDDLELLELQLWEQLSAQHGLDNAGPHHSRTLVQVTVSLLASFLTTIILTVILSISLLFIGVLKDPEDLKDTTTASGAAGSSRAHSWSAILSGGAAPHRCTCEDPTLSARWDTGPSVAPVQHHSLQPSSCPLHTSLLPPLLNTPLFHLASASLSIIGVCLFVLHCVCCLLCWLLNKVMPGVTRCTSSITSSSTCVFKPGGLFTFLHSKDIHYKKCVTNFHWDDATAIVGNTVSFTVQFFQRNGRPYPISDADRLCVEIAVDGRHRVNVAVEVGGTSEEELNTARCQFTPRRAGQHVIIVMVAQTHIKGSPFHRTFKPGPPCLEHSVLVSHSSTVVCVAMQQHTLLLEPRDEYHNLCSFDPPAQEESHAYNLTVTQSTNEGTQTVECNNIVAYYRASQRYSINFLLREPGCYNATLRYRDDLVPQGNFSIIVLGEEDSQRVQKKVGRRQLDGLEAILISTQSSPALSSPQHSSSSSSSLKRVYCYITPKQLVLREYFLKIIPKRVCTFRLCPSTKLHFNNILGGLPTLTIDDGCQAPVTIASKDRNVIAATFTQFMLRNIGGSETFKDKQNHFYYEVRKYHSKRQHDRLPITINREKLLESSMKSTRHFSVSDWCRNFEITFSKEEGIDWGGIGREWVELLCAELFDRKGGLFTSFTEENSSQSLVHPNPNRPPHLKLKHYEFAGRLVGKCLYESAVSCSGQHLLVRARFTRSFLAQIIGLRVNYRHFAQDDPELYHGKVQHLLQHGTDLLPEPLYFNDQVVLPNGIIKTVELEPGGNSKFVTNSNIAEYLDSLAQFRLATRVHAEIQAFLEGLNDIIPDNLLCIFDENELELLMCGTEEYSIADLKANHVISGSSNEFKRVLYWFWTAVANFTEEEMARLLQFITGCSRLPPGGFSQLSPQLQITPSHTYNSLPTAHTCFNQLCLPDYDTYEQLEKSLLIAIKEGSEGFSLV